MSLFCQPWLQELEHGFNDAIIDPPKVQLCKEDSMRQLLVECSDPGIVVSLAEEFENILRQVDFARAQQL